MRCSIRSIPKVLLKISEEKQMNKRLIAGIMLTAVLLSGCSNVTEPSAVAAATVGSSAASSAEKTSEATTTKITIGTTETTETTPVSTDVQTSEENAEESSSAAADSSYKKITLSGKAKDKITVEEDCYYEGDRFVLYFGKGARIDGSIADKVKRIMSEDEKVSGLSFNEYKYAQASNWREEIFGGKFKGINEDMKKVNIVVVKDPEDDRIQWAVQDCVYLFDTDFDLNRGSFDTVFHELGHALRLRNGNNLGQIFEEGFAIYLQDKVSRKEKYADWSFIQYVTYGSYKSLYDDSELLKDPEKCFIRTNTLGRSAVQEHYHYGIRFITFLYETYGPDAVKKITKVSHKYTYEAEDTETIIKIIKEATSKDVFTRFKKWLPKGWKKHCGDYVKYIEKAGK